MWGKEVSATLVRKKKRIWVKGGDEGVQVPQRIDASNKAGGTLPTPQIKPPPDTSKYQSRVRTNSTLSTTITPSQALPLPLLQGDHHHGLRKRDNYTTPSAGTQATTPHTRRRHCLRK